MHPWLEEFYPTPASEAAGSDRQALEHSLKKWIGLRPENLTKHGVMTIAGDLYADGIEVLAVDSKTCALCKRHMAETYEDHPCEACPLYAAREGDACDEDSTRGQLSPFQAYTIGRDPEPMIALIRQALRRA